MKTNNILSAVLCIGAVALYTGSNQAQDIHFSQFSSSPSTLNPASTGVFEGVFRVVGNYKDQWRSIAYPYTTISGSFDMPVHREVIKNGALNGGVSFFSDKAGDLKFGTTQFNLSVAANKIVSNRHLLSAGLQGGFAQRKIDDSQARWDKQWTGTTYDPAQLSGEKSNPGNYGFADFSLGGLWKYAITEAMNVNAGLALFHLNRPNQGFFDDTEKLYSKVVFHGGGEIGLKDMPLSFVPGWLLLLQGPQKEINAGGLVKYSLGGGKAKKQDNTSETFFYIGGWYRFGDAAIANIRVDFLNFSLGLSYDINISDLNIATGSRGGMEFSLTYIHPQPKQLEKRRSLM